MARILIVDDERNIVYLLRQMFAEYGYETCEAFNGLAGLKAFQSQFFDLVITDLRMPKMDGMSFLHEIKLLDPAMPVIVLTAYDSPETAAEAKKKGAFVYLAKPFQMTDLMGIVETQLGSPVNKPGAILSPAVASCVPDGADVTGESADSSARGSPNLGGGL